MIQFNSNAMRLVLIPVYLVLAYGAFVFVEQRFIVTIADLQTMKPAVLIMVASAAVQLISYCMSVVRGRKNV